MSSSYDYDILIVGAGIAGLRCALTLKQKHPQKRIAIAEKYTYVGGRIYTYHPKEFPGIHWESGAGRIHGSHTKTLALLKRHKLTLFPLSPDAEFRFSANPTSPIKDPWPAIASMIVQSLSAIKEQTLRTHTVRSLLTDIHGKTKADALLAPFPYRAEVDILRADLALQSFRHEMKSSTDFFVVKEGLDVLMDHLTQEAKSKGIDFLFDHELIRVKDHTAIFKHKTITADKLLLALHSRALRTISPFTQHPLIKKVVMCPLLRIYAVFDRPWFADLPKTVTDSPLRFVIPINANAGTIMISYTDASDTQVWSKKSDTQVQKAILKEARRIFPEREIPEPLYFKTHLWKAGCSYWGVGDYDVRKASQSMLHPYPSTLPNVYICGESFSLRQCWIEGALDHADELLEKYF